MENQINKLHKGRIPGSTSMAAQASRFSTDKFRGATVEDLDPPPALSVHTIDLVSHAIAAAFERDYTHLTVVSRTNRALLGYLSIPRLKLMLREGKVAHEDPVEKAMQKFKRKGRTYRVITMNTSLEELEGFFAHGFEDSGSQEFAIVTDPSRRFVLGVATRNDLNEFIRRRP